jgi:hypothetical protein
MNILTENLPEKIQIGNNTVELVTDYRASIEFELLVENGVEDLQALLQPFFPDGLRCDISIATEAVLWFYSCGAERTQKEDKQNKAAERKRIYSFRVDAEAIYSDFSRFYNLDLSSAKLHWWKFRALLMGLPEDSAFKKRIYYRTCDLKDLPKKEQKRIRDIRKEIEIKDVVRGGMTLEERNAQMLEYVKRRGAEVQSEVK